jgi:hypothetical protein
MNSRTHNELPRDAVLKGMPEIPWDAMNTLAEALPGNTALLEELTESFETARRSGDYYTVLYVAGIFVMAGPRLNTPSAGKAGDFFVAQFLDKDTFEDDLMFDLLIETCCALGPAILPRVLDHMEKTDHRSTDHYGLMHLGHIARRAEDTPYRKRLVRRCEDMLRMAIDGDLDTLQLVPVVWTLAALHHTESLPLLKRLAEANTYKATGYEEVVACRDYLAGETDKEPWPEMWDSPLTEWLPKMVEEAGAYMAEAHECHNHNAEPGEDLSRELAEGFLHSERARNLPEDVRTDARFIAEMLLQYAWDYLEIGPAELDLDALDEILLDLLPQKVTAQREVFEHVAPVLREFFLWLESEGILSFSGVMVEFVEDHADLIVRHAMDPDNWGKAKTITMDAIERGIDLDDEETISEFIADHNRRLELPVEQPARKPRGAFPCRPRLQRDGPKVGRNDPCPCGRGKKYKNCHGRKGR